MRKKKGVLAIRESLAGYETVLENLVFLKHANSALLRQARKISELYDDAVASDLQGRFESIERFIAAVKKTTIKHGKPVKSQKGKDLS
jgi:hypothetical protein